MTCLICDETFNKTIHTSIQCQYCDFKACRKCCETFILDKPVATCMKNDCKKEWTRKYLNTVFTGKFVNGAWKANLENIFFEREKALLPATQGVVEMLIENEKRALEVRAIEQQIKELTNQKVIITNRMNNQIIQSELAPVRAQTLFIRPCADADCRGFLNSAWNCGLCQKSTCNECHLIKKDDHVCNADDVATAKLLKSDTKPCPKCSTGIYKIDGCDQMWCTECRTAFNWRTGQLETGHVHNPHYFEYQRRIGANTRNILDMPCNALAPNQYHGILRHLIYIAMNSASCSPIERVKNGLKPITNVTRLHIRERTLAYAISIDHYAEYVLPRYRPDAIQNNLELRVLYLIEQISKDEFKSSLSREAKQFNKKIEIGQVVQTVIFGMSDILTRLVNFLRETHRPINNNGINAETDVNFCDHDKIFEMFSEIDALIEYANECLEFICKQYNLTRVAIFVRDTVKKHQSGLYSTRVIKEETPDGIRDVLVPVKAM